MNPAYSTNLTQMYVNANNPKIIGRDKETELLMLTLLRYEKPNAVLYGEPGVGKTAIVHNLAYMIANELCSDMLKGFQVIEVNTNALIAGPGYRGTTEAKFEDLIQTSLSSKKTILFVDEFHTVENLGCMANGQTPGLGNTLKPYLTRPDFRVIGCTTTAEYKAITDKALLRRFYSIEVVEPNDEAVLAIIETCVLKYGSSTVAKRGSELTISRTIFPEILSLSKSISGFNPDKAKDICDFVCSYAKLHAVKSIDLTLLKEFFDMYIALRPKAEVITEVSVID